MQMKDKHTLFLHEELMLLALRDEKGTVSADFIEQTIAGAIMAELLLDQHISIEDNRKKRIAIHHTNPVGDPVIDECLEKMRVSKRPVSLENWIDRLSGIKNLSHKAAQQLCNRGILRADEDKVLFIFNRKIYPEINPVPEKQIIERLREAIFTDKTDIDPRTVVLISLTNSSELLNQIFDRKELKTRKKRIEQIIKGEMLGKATKEIIEACQAAIMIASIMPLLIVNAGN